MIPDEGDLEVRWGAARRRSVDFDCRVPALCLAGGGDRGRPFPDARDQAVRRDRRDARVAARPGHHAAGERVANLVFRLSRELYARAHRDRPTRRRYVHRGDRHEENGDHRGAGDSFTRGGNGRAALGDGRDQAVRRDRGKLDRVARPGHHAADEGIVVRICQLSCQLDRCTRRDRRSRRRYVYRSDRRRRAAATHVVAVGIDGQPYGIRDGVPRNQLVVAAVLCHEHAQRVAAAQRHVGDIDTISPGDSVNSARANLERRHIVVVAFPAVDDETVIPLAGRDQVTLSLAAIVYGQAFDIIRQLAGRPSFIDLRPCRAITRLSTVLPDRYVLLADVEKAELVIGHHALDLGARIELTDLLAAYRSSLIEQLPLFDVAAA